MRQRDVEILDIEVRIAVVGDVEQGAVRDLAREVGAVVDGVLKEIRLPSADEVAVVSEARRISIRQQELARLVLEAGCSEDRLVEEGRDAHWIAIWACAIAHDEISVGHV